MTRLYAGIDPGVLGAIAFLNDSGELLSVVDMPHDVIEKRIIRKGVSKVTERKRVSAFGVADALRVNGVQVHVVVERVSSMPGEGVSSAFTFGEAVGLVCGAVAGLGHQLTMVIPQVWKRAVGCGPGKDGSRLRACQLFPSWSETFRRVKDDGRAESALIAWYGWSVAKR